MTADTKLLPLPESDCQPNALRWLFPVDQRERVQDYARANVSHATAPLQAEIERLRSILIDLKDWDCDVGGGFLSIPVGLRRRMQEVLAAAPEAAGEPCRTINIEDINIDDIVAWADGVQGALGTEHANRVTEREAAASRAVMTAIASAPDRCPHGVRRPHECKECADTVPASEALDWAEREFAAARQSPGEPVQGEPVAWLSEWESWQQYHDESDPMPEAWDNPPTKITPLYAAPQPAERPAVCGYAQALSICKRGLEDWKSKSHNKRWWKMIDGTPIPNDLLSCIAESFAAEQQPAACRCVDCGGDQPEHDTHCAHMHNLHVPAPEQQAATINVTYTDGVGAGRSRPEDCRYGVSYVTVADTVYWPLSAEDAQLLRSAECGRGDFTGPGTSTNVAHLVGALEDIAHAHAAAPLQAEIEALRVEVEQLQRQLRQAHKDYGCELRDPNGTIWEYAAMQRDRAVRLAEALRVAEAALADIGDVDVAWCKRRATQALPTVRAALRNQEDGK